MCVPESKLVEISNDTKYIHHRESNPKQSTEEFIRDIHHEISYDFILKEYELLKIYNKDYAKAIAIVARGHRKVALDEIEIYEPKKFVRSGREFVCLPYLAAVLRLADELDITNVRTPEILTKYYMPNNEESIKEWKKHISTTQRNFTEDKVIFRVNCSDHNNLAALEDQFKKIENTINYCQKIIRFISNTEDRRFSLKLLQVESIYEYINFDPKGIKFSFNVQNVVNTFIGKDLYEDELVSIREVIQNSIDSCRYKKKINVDDYKPEISVIIKKEKIEIKDNGLGMDEFIVENFFGRLGSSFYEQDKIKNEFEAIGQFGVGVFSYFLTSEFIDIETKTQNGIPLHFRIDKDPQNYFHFFDNAERNETGTTTTLRLKNKIQNKYNFNDYVKYIRRIFKYIEFSIKIEGENDTIILESLSLSCNSNKEIRNRIHIQYRSDIDNYDLFKYSINCDEYEGECAVIINKFTENFTFENTHTKFDYDAFMTINGSSGLSQFAISQKGIFVNNYPARYLDLVFGYINLKKRTKININRKDFSDMVTINRIINEFSINLIKELFNELKKKYKKKQMLVKLSNEFVKNYLSRAYPKYLDLKKLSSVLQDSLFVEMIKDSKRKIISINELLASTDEFILLSYKEFKGDISKKMKLPIVLVLGLGFDGAWSGLKEILVRLLQFTPSVIMLKNKGYQKFSKSKYQEYLNKINKIMLVDKYFFSECEDIDSNLIAVNVSFNKEEFIDRYLTEPTMNLKHPFFKFYLKNFKKIIDSNDLSKIIRTSFYLINRYSEEQKINKPNLDRLNQLLKPLEKIEKPWFFTEKDFQTKEK